MRCVYSAFPQPDSSSWNHENQFFSKGRSKWGSINITNLQESFRRKGVPSPEITSLIEEAEAIGWYEQRMSLEKGKEAKVIMASAQNGGFKHFGMNLEFLLRRNKDWRTELQGILLTKGDILSQAEAAEKKVD